VRIMHRRNRCVNACFLLAQIEWATAISSAYQSTLTREESSDVFSKLLDVETLWFPASLGYPVSSSFFVCRAPLGPRGSSHSAASVQYLHLARRVLECRVPQITFLILLSFSLFCLLISRSIFTCRRRDRAFCLVECLGRRKKALASGLLA